MSGDEISRPMKYPYTISAKIAQFPYRFHYENHWFYKYGIFGIVFSLPIIYQIHKMANSPGNIRQWEEKRRKEEAERHAH